MKPAWRALALLWLALTLAGCSVLTWPGPSCVSLNNGYAETINATQGADLPDAFVRVPVTIHLMTDPDDPAAKRPGKFWTPQRVEKYFGLGNRSANMIWGEAQIHFDLTLVQRCRYKPFPGTFELTSGGAKGMFPPDAFTLRSKPPLQQQRIINHYLLLNVAYGVPRTLNVYFWRAHAGGVNGYGESPRRNRVEVLEHGLDALPTVWYESWLACGDIPEIHSDECQLGIAHELGHALGLSHSCRLCDCNKDLCWVPRNYYYHCELGIAPVQTWPNWADCERNPGDPALTGFTACGGELFECCGPQHDTRERLMYPVATETPKAGKKLCPGEVRSARRAAMEFFPNHAGGTAWLNRNAP